MGRFAEASWWWEYGLDGLVGGIAGGIVAWGAVWLTLRGTRRQGEEQAGELAVARLQAAGIRTVLMMGLIEQVHDAVSAERIMDEAGELATALAEARVRTTHRWPAMAERLRDLTDEMGERPPEMHGGDQMTAVANQCTALATTFLEDPDSYGPSPWWQRKRSVAPRDT